MQNKKFSRMERIRYYAEVIYNNWQKPNEGNRQAVEYALRRLDHLTSEHYVDKVELEETKKKIKTIAKKKKSNAA